MQKNEKSKKNSNKKLRTILDDIPIEDLSFKEKKYLTSLGKRLERQSVKDTFHYKKILGVENEKEIDPLKPHVTIHRRKERKSFEIPEIKKYIEEEKKEITKIPAKDEETYEAEKVEIREPQFIEVKPKETLKVQEEKPFEDIGDEELAEWEPIDVKDEKIDVKVSEPGEEKTIIDTSKYNYCIQCGTKIKKGDFNFCPECGTKLILEGEKQELFDEKNEVKEELDSAPSFFTVKKIEEENESVEWKSVETDIAEDEEEISVKDVEIEKKDEEEKEDIEREEKTNAFKDIECIDEKTAVLLYDNGFTSVDDLKTASLKDLKKVDGVNRKLAKKIKKEIEETVELASKEDNGFSEHLIGEDFERDEDRLIDEKISKEKDEEYFDTNFEEKKTEESNVFKDMNSIDQKTAKLLYENDITSVDILKDMPIEELTKIRGIRRKLAKKIKKELSAIPDKKEEKEPEEDTTYDGDDLGGWECIDDENISESKPEKIKGYRYGEYILYEKKIAVKGGLKRTVRFFSKVEPDEGVTIDLPDGYEVRENKKTGVPYLKKKK